jgi:hypothetical protein
MRTLPLLALALVIAGCASTAPPEGPYVLRPLGEGGEQLPPGEPRLVEVDGARVSVTPLTGEELERWRGRVEPAGSIRELPELIVLRLTVTATRDLPVHLETQSIVLHEQQGPAALPLDYTRAYELVRTDIETSPDPADVERLMEGALDGAVDVPPGATRSGLLVFPAQPRVAERGAFLLDLPFLQVGSTTHRLRIPFVAEPLAEETAP